MAYSRRLLQELKELSKPSVTHLGVLCATSVSLSAHHHYPARHLAACRPFLGFLAHFCLLPTTVLDRECWNKKAALSACKGISVYVP